MANLKRHMIEIVKEVKAGETVTEKFLTPIFLPMSVVYEAIDLSAEIEKVADDDSVKKEKELMEKMLVFVSDKIYGKQFTKDQLFNGLHAPDAIKVLQDQILFVSRGMQNDETKKYLAKKN
ncbi:phage tail assembly chaperone G [Virgibacillus chiguensis]|uniref:Phage protein n=1 Tax=Virgibacillus chiguensis TaxID=411959 RepID=A0A1M5XQP5_9BACI|nr:hypothetical protein [Virgibacillus chiguensis]SHI02141.1 hypothetical protein SAMN05421807_1333 [Virgibacillus chiguensis]